MRPLGFPREWINAVSISIAFSLEFLIRNENIIFEERKTKNRLKLSFMRNELQALKVWWLAQSKKSCHGQTLMLNFWLLFQLRRLVTHTTCKIISNGFFCFLFLGSYIFIYDQNVNAKSNRNRNCIFYSPLGIPRVARWIIVSPDGVCARS